MDGCDGSDLSMSSICCEQHNYQECPYEEGCIDNKKGSNYIHNQKSSQKQLIVCQIKISVHFILNFCIIHQTDKVDMLLACGNDGTKMIITPSNVTDIYSPNFPETYPNSLNCKWHVKTGEGFRIELQIKGQELEEKYLNNLIKYSSNYFQIL